MWQSIQKNITWRAIPIAGFVAGTIFLIVNILVMTLVMGLNAETLLRYAASVVLGPSVLITSSIGVTLFGVVMHYVFCLLTALVIAIVVHRWGLGVGIVGGAILGLCIYIIVFYLGTLALPWLFAITGPLLALTHVMMGAIAGGIYESLDRYDLPLEVGVR